MGGRFEGEVGMAEAGGRGAGRVEGEGHRGNQQWVEGEAAADR